MRRAACLILLSVTACGSGQGGLDVCAPWKAIVPQPEDVDVISGDLARQIVDHDETGVELGCWPAPTEE